MSLKSSLLKLADQMEHDNKHRSVLATKSAIKNYVNQIRLLCEVAEDRPANLPAAPGIMTLGDSTAQAQHTEAIEAARREFRRAEIKERVEDSVAYVVDGPLAGNNAPVPASMPVGAKTYLAGVVYELCKDGQFRLVKEEEVEHAKELETCVLGPDGKTLVSVDGK